MEGLIGILQRIQTTIQKGFLNFKKSPKERLTLEYIETRQELLEQHWAKFEETHCKFHEKYSADEKSKEVDEIYDFTEDSYINYKSLMKSLLNKLSVKVSTESKTEESCKKSSSFVKLPKISIPTFSGNYTEWTTFNDLFKALVHKNESLNDCQKLHYLKNHLTGEAEQLIRHTPISDANYAQCWDILEKRYNNKKYLSNCVLKRLFSQRRLHSESGTGLKELFDTTNDCLNALKNLNVDVSTWDIIIIYIIATKLDFETRKQWELSVGPTTGNELPTFEQFKLFIENRYRALEFIEPNKASGHQGKESVSYHSKALLVTSTSSLRCEYCKESSHKLCFCKKFARQPVESRRDFVAKQNICFNCLGSNHIVYECKKPTSCRVCKKRHHSLLHPNPANFNSSSNESLVKPSNGESSNAPHDAPIVSCLSTGTVPKPRQVLLATALIKAESKSGHQQTVRALLDQGSQACFITEATVQLLGLKRIPIQGIITGLGNSGSTPAKFMVQVTIQSRADPKFILQLNAYVLNKITAYLPERVINANNFDWIKTQGLYLADPQFNIPNKIDLLLGADIYSHIIQERIVKCPLGTLIAQSTALGWVLSGAVNAVNIEKSITRNISVMHAQINEDDVLRKFWEIEEPVTTKICFTPEEEKCEELYKQTTKRCDDGRYVVRLPFRDIDPPCKAGNSRGIAEARFRSLEKRLEKNIELKKEYTKVIQEYLDLDHMRAVKKNDKKRGEAVYLPHHAVIREDKTTTKVRVVFNASEKNNKGISLNDTLMVGPTLQADLRHTILRWRHHAIGLVADIIKMYRQVKIAEEDSMFQRILWRDHPDMPIQDYELLTVTFGTASAPYQAVRTLHQTAYDEGGSYPLASERVLNAFYMDDLMTGCDSVEQGAEIIKQITALLRTGGFELQKWNSNNKEMFEVIRLMDMNMMKKQLNETSKYEKDNEMTHNKNEDENITQIRLDNTIKILGLTWIRSTDVFQYSVNLPSKLTLPVTKRAVVSEIARLFDPLGWLAPCVVLAKVFIQKLWLAGVGWDEELNLELVKEWCTYREELTLITKVRIPRWLGTKSNDDLELHGFSDASKVAYSAVVYLRRIDLTGQIHVSLLVSKTRVAPIKQISIPRLELCGAVLLAQLLSETAKVLNISPQKVTAWTDSMVVLAWINSHPSRWKTFVANRTAEILTTTKPNQWFHVSTKDNPADCASRGLLPSLFVECKLWFSGPPFLKDININYKRAKDFNTDLEESIKSHVAVFPDNTIIERFSSLPRLLRVVAYCRRFLNKGRNIESYLQRQEIEKALEICIRKVQRDIFTEEYTHLQSKEYIPSKSKLKALCPYLDHRGIMRVKGRIERSQLDEQTKHPIVLPSGTHLTNLIVADAHNKTLHGGPQLMLNYLRTAYWIIGAKNLVKNHVRKCVTCVRHRANSQNQLMGSLPTVRCTPARPFLHSGVDYAGPINIRTTRGRGHHSYKGYICLFVCMCTRALHLEVVSDMSTQAFLAAFRRFVSRRGHCAKLWSDNGTTFVGASRELQQLTSYQSEIAKLLESNGTEWHFIPPHGPNFGGLWEAGVKSTKFHLKRVIGESTLTYEELSTLLIQVEACLNSRPINVINTTDPGAPMPLTPGHFLIGEPIINVPDYTYENSNVNCLSRWQFVQRMLESFWRRWSSEYLANLMHRYKWSKQVSEPKIGDVVLIKEDDLPPSRWLFGRIEQKHPGNDNLTRVVTLRTKSSVLKRPTSKLCILPVCAE